MQILTPSSLPSHLQSELLAQPGFGGKVPGFILDAEMLYGHSAQLASAIDGLRLSHDLLGPPSIVLPPRETAAIFADDELLVLLHDVSAQLAKLLDARLKTGIDGIWLVYKAFKLYKDWQHPDKNIAGCAFKLADIALGAAGLIGGYNPDLKIPDPWANGLNFIVSSGGALMQGKVPSPLLPDDARVEIPLKILKVAGLLLEQAHQPQTTPAVAMPAALISPIRPVPENS